ncbi:hypothetical protein CVT26_009912 [Gymnopilus dilepis]|uniref:Uncharacterized protein n=1 Tax=Gymnopilus dilepis TaxID=231916 RepID=A0A409YBZ0_9AGAR|nr:hypothetical protein CVT26_009912 [Gymnopilus dilepis]
MHLDCIRQGIKVKATPSRCTAWVKPGHSADDVLAKLPPSVRREVKLDWDTKAGLVGLSGTFNDESRSMLRNFPEIASVEEEDAPYPQRIDRTDSDQPYEL